MRVGVRELEIWDHAFEVDCVTEEEVSGEVVHPPTCFAIHHCHPSEHYHPLRSVERPSCAIDYEQVNIGLLDRATFDGSWTSLAVDLYPGGESAVMDLFARHHAEDRPVPIYAYVAYGWSPSTPVSEAEYEWEFSWRPQTPEEIAGHRGR